MTHRALEVGRKEPTSDALQFEDLCWQFETVVDALPGSLHRLDTQLTSLHVLLNLTQTFAHCFPVCFVLLTLSVQVTDTTIESLLSLPPNDNDNQ